MKLIRAVTLDFYGTLVEEDDANVQRICRDISSAGGGFAAPAEIGTFWWQQLADIYDRAHGDQFVSEYEASIAALSRTLRQFRADLDAEEIIHRQVAAWRTPRRFVDALPFVQWLAHRGITVCLLSNVDTAELTRSLRHCGMSFERVVTSEMARAYKPRPEIFAMALDVLGTAPNETLHIGDSRTTDLAGSANMGMPFAWINRTGKPPLNDGSTITATSLAELVTILDGETA